MVRETADLTSRNGIRPGSAPTLQLRRLWGASGPAPPWDDTGPIRAELFSVERLEEHARSLAAAQAVTPGQAKGVPLAKRLADNEAVLAGGLPRCRRGHRLRATAITPAAEWLVDNFHLVEKQIREVRA